MQERIHAVGERGGGKRRKIATGDWAVEEESTPEAGVTGSLERLYRWTVARPTVGVAASVWALLPNQAAAALALAKTKLHSFKYADVPAHWRAYYTDACIFLAVQAWRTRKLPESALAETVKWLDYAIVVAGAEGHGRRSGIDSVLEEMELYLAASTMEQPDRHASPTPGMEIHDASQWMLSSHPVRRAHCPSLDTFEQLTRPGARGVCQPLVIEAGTQHWPALSVRKWTDRQYLLQRTLGGRRIVPVELGRSYTDPGWGQQLMPLADFLSSHIDSRRGGPVGYLAQHDLLAQVPKLRADIAIPDYCYLDPPPLKPPQCSHPEVQKLPDPLIHTWLGPAGTVSPLHTDPYHNILVQLQGRKYVRLYSPEHGWAGRMYPLCSDAGETVDMSNTSRVDATQPNLQTFPRFAEADYVDVVLGEGEMLYIPQGWWHYVQSISASFSVSFWWN